MGGVGGEEKIFKRTSESGTSGCLKLRMFWPLDNLRSLLVTVEILRRVKSWSRRYTSATQVVGMSALLMIVPKVGALKGSGSWKLLNPIKTLEKVFILPSKYFTFQTLATKIY